MLFFCCECLFFVFVCFLLEGGVVLLLLNVFVFVCVFVLCCIAMYVIRVSCCAVVSVYC